VTSTIRDEAHANAIQIRVSAPGCTDTRCSARQQERHVAGESVNTEAFVQGRLTQITLGRFATPEQTGATAVH
jgi:hypothetical protein